MAIFSSIRSVDFLMFPANLSTPDSTLTANSTFFDFRNGGPYGSEVRIQISGSGFAFGGDGFPTAGTVSQVEIDQNNPLGQPFRADATVTGISVGLAEIVPNNPDVAQNLDAFWSTLLAGNDSFTTESGYFFGDFYQVTGAERLVGGDDTFDVRSTFIGGSGFFTVIGDADQVYDGGRLSGGNDTISVDAGRSADLLVAGDASLALGDGTRVTGGDDSITVDNGTGYVALYGDLVEMVQGVVLAGGNDTVVGATTSDDIIFGDTSSIAAGTVTGGNDLLSGRGGNDEIYGDAMQLSGGQLIGGNDTLNGGAGNDLLVGDVLTVTGGALTGGNDRLFGDAGDDTLVGGGGFDRLEGGTGNDSLDGGDQGDILLGEDGDDTLSGGQGADRLVAGDGADELNGGLTSDLLLGGAGDDTLSGDEGDDTLRGGNDDDIGLGGVGNDVVIGGTGRDTLNGQGDDDIVRGTGGFDTVNGGDGNDLVAGGAQADLALGGAGNDTVQGGGGFDTIDGGTGDDELTGNFNADQFIFVDGHGNDTITDFEATNNAEKIDLSAVSAITSLSDLNLASASNGAATQVGADVVIDTGGGSSITLTGVSLGDLDANDFVF